MCLKELSLLLLRYASDSLSLLQSLDAKGEIRLCFCRSSSKMFEKHPHFDREISRSQSPDAEKSWWSILL